MPIKFYSPKLYLKDPWVLVPSVVSLVCLLLSVLYLFFTVPTGETTYFLHTTIVFGVDLVGGYGSLYVPLIAGSLVCVINQAFAFTLYGSERFLARLLLFFMACAEIGIALSVYLVVKLNI